MIPSITISSKTPASGDPREGYVALALLKSCCLIDLTPHVSVRCWNDAQGPTILTKPPELQMISMSPPLDLRANCFCLCNCAASKHSISSSVHSLPILRLFFEPSKKPDCRQTIASSKVRRLVGPLALIDTWIAAGGWMAKEKLDVVAEVEEDVVRLGW